MKRKSPDSNVFILSFVLLFLSTSCLQDRSQEQIPGPENFRFLEYNINQIHDGYMNKSFTISEVVQAYIDRIVDVDQNGPGLNSVICINPDALSIAAQLDSEMLAGKIRGPLHGIPVLLKDNIDTHDKMPTTAGSRALANSFPLKDSYLAQKLREAGAVIIGKTNLSEWANFRGEMSTSGWSGEGGLTKNPYELSRNPCGSSSGSGAAVSANLAMLAIGTETDGSIVCPSQANGIVGIKPTVGLISRSGVIPISFSQDTPGPMARTVRDAAICLGALTGIDSADEKTLASKGNFKTDYTVFLNENGLKSKRIGIDKSSLGINYKVDSLFNKTVETLKNQGVEIFDINEIISKKTEGYSFNVMLFEYKDGLNKYFQSLGDNGVIKNISDLIEFNRKDSIELRYFNQKFLEMAEKKADLGSPEYLEALKKMHQGSREEGIDKVMDEYKLDAIIAPTGSPAWKTDLINGDSYSMGSSSPAAIAGYPNITVPMGYIDGLPVGISFFGRAWSEPVLIEIAYAFENATKVRVPPGFRD